VTRSVACTRRLSLPTLVLINCCSCQLPSDVYIEIDVFCCIQSQGWKGQLGVPNRFSSSPNDGTEQSKQRLVGSAVPIPFHTACSILPFIIHSVLKWGFYSCECFHHLVQVCNRVRLYKARHVYLFCSCI
jgi:hypothetical protein